MRFFSAEVGVGLGGFPLQINEGGSMPPFSLQRRKTYVYPLILLQYIFSLHVYQTDLICDFPWLFRIALTVFE